MINDIGGKMIDTICMIFGLICVFFIFLKTATAIIKTLIFSTGYTLIYILNYNKKKVVNNPVKILKITLIRFVDGCVEYTCQPYTLTSCRVGEWVYYPLFKIKKC